MPSQRCFLVPVAVVLLLSLVTSSRGASEAEPSTETRSQRYVVPDGDASVLVEFIMRLSEYRPTTAGEDIEHRCNCLPALKQAAEKIVSLEIDETTPAYEAAEFILLFYRIRSLAQAVRREQDKALADVKAYVEQRIEKSQGEVAARMAQLAAKTCQATGQYGLAADVYSRLGEVLEECDDRSTANEGARMQAHASQLLTLSRTVAEVPKAPEIPAGCKLVSLDIQMAGNCNIMGSTGSGQFAGNGLAELERGEQTLGGVPFQIGAKVVRLAGVKVLDGVRKVEGIPVNRRMARLYILHATDNGSPDFVDGTKIGSYAIRYEDGSEESIPIVYGEDVRDWWDFDEGKPVTRGRVVWTAGNFAADKFEVTIRLYLGVWENPHPGKKVNTIDYVSSKGAQSKPFCVAMTVEEPREE